MTHKNAKSLITPTIDEHENLANDLLVVTRDHVLKLLEELDFVSDELKKQQERIRKCKDIKKLESLYDSYWRLTDIFTKITERIIIGYMAHYTPMSNLIKRQNESKRIEEIAEVPQLPEATQKQLEPEFDISAVYKKYED